MAINCAVNYSSWTEVKKLITCAQCGKLLEEPHSLICCHTFCKLCIKKRDFKKCPSCPGNKLIPFKVVCFENLYLTRLATIFRNWEFTLKGTCLLCKTQSVMCTNCFVFGCITCNRRKTCTDESTSHKFNSVNFDGTPESLLGLTLFHFCTVHSDTVITNYCCICHEEKCQKCITMCTDCNHNSDTIQCIKEKLVNNLTALMQDGEVQQMLQREMSDLEQHKDLLHEQYKKQYALTEQSYNHKIYSLCQEKQVVLSKIMALWSIINRAIENYKTEIYDLQKLTNNFYTHLTILTNKSSDKEIIAYYTKERKRYGIDTRIESLKKAIYTIQREIANFLSQQQILQKYREQQQLTVKNDSFLSMNLSATLHSKAGINFKQEYQLLKHDEKLFKIDQLQVKIFVGDSEAHSMFALPLPSSKVVQATRQQLLVVSKCAQCLSQLQLFSKALGHKYPERNLQKIIKSLNDYLLGSNKELLSVTADAITVIKTAITYLHTKKILLYCVKLNENLDKLAGFIKKSTDYYSELEVFYFEQQAFHINHDQSAMAKSSVVYTSMLLDIMIDCRTYITNTKHICEKLFSIQKTIEIVCKECRSHANLNNEEPIANSKFKKLIASNGFQLQIVLHYSSWVALNEICKNTEELIACWNIH